jgi:hypothetical protein
MAEDNDPKEILDLDLPTEGHSFDELAKGIANRDISRSRALAMIGTAILGGFLGTFALPNESEAKKKKKKRKGKKKPKTNTTTTCSKLTGAPPCCPGYTPCNDHCCLDGTQCCESTNFCLLPGETCCPSALPLTGFGFCSQEQFCCEFACCPKAPGVICGPDPQIPCITV